MTPVRRACATLLHFDSCSTLRSQSLSLSANDMQDTAHALQPRANTAPFLSFPIVLPFALFPNLEEEQQLTSDHRSNGNMDEQAADRASLRKGQ